MSASSAFLNSFTAWSSPCSAASSTPSALDPYSASFNDIQPRCTAAATEPSLVDVVAVLRGKVLEFRRQTRPAVRRSRRNAARDRCGRCRRACRRPRAKPVASVFERLDQIFRGPGVSGHVVLLVSGGCGDVPVMWFGDGVMSVAQVRLSWDAGDPRSAGGGTLDEVVGGLPGVGELRRIRRRA